jgi:fructose-1,6-bisphosphatase
MKKLFSSLSLLISTFAFAQGTDSAGLDSSMIAQSVTISQNHHLFLIGAMYSIETPDAFNYIRQVKLAYDPADTSKQITVNVPSRLIVSMYQSMTVKPEGVTTQYNNDIKYFLLSQVTNPWLFGQLLMISIENQRQLQIIMKKGKDFIESIQ